jgi:hypothetical protein
MQASKIVRAVITSLSIVLVATTLIGASWYTTREMPAPTSMVAVPTGELQDGVPVYRLPSITVSASRSEVLSQAARGEQR